MLSVESLWKCSVLLVLLTVAGGAPMASGAAEAPAARPLELSALTGAEGADLYVHAPPGTTVFEHLHIRIRAPEGSSEQANRIVNLKDVAAPNGIAAVELGQLARGAAVDVEAQVREASPPRTAVHRGEATVKLRPGPLRGGRPCPAPDADHAGDRRGGRPVRAERRDGRDRHREADARPDARRGTANDHHARRWRPLGDVPEREADDRDVGRPDRRPRRCRAGRDRRNEQQPRGDGRGDRARARPLQRPRSQPRRLRRAVQPARLRPGDERAPGDASRPGGEGHRPRAAACQDLL